MGEFVFAGSSGEWGWHATELALRCPQLFAYTYRLKVLQKTESEALLRGSLVHAGLAQHYKQMQEMNDPAGDPNYWATPWEGIDHCAKELGPAAQQYVDTAKGIITSYKSHYAMEQVWPVAVEEVFSAEIEGYKFTQRLDLVARERDGKVYIWDHKCVGRIDQKTVTRYTLSGQFLGMARFGAATYGSDFGGVRLNLISADGLSFRRALVDPAPHALRTFPASVRHARYLVDALDEAKVPYDEWPKALSEQVCVSTYGVCPAFELCRWGPK
jgi:hypothetical protein